MIQSLNDFWWLHRGAERTDLHGRTLDFSLFMLACDPSAPFSHHTMTGIMWSGLGQLTLNVLLWGSRKWPVTGANFLSTVISKFISSIHPCWETWVIVQGLSFSISPSPHPPCCPPPSPVTLPSVSLSLICSHIRALVTFADDDSVPSSW